MTNAEVDSAFVIASPVSILWNTKLTEPRFTVGDSRMTGPSCQMSIDRRAVPPTGAIVLENFEIHRGDP
jgi:hypothetical protein